MAKALGFSAVAVAASLAGCNPFGDADFIGGDAGGDGGGGDGVGEFCYGAMDGLVRACFATPPTGVRELDGQIDTSSPDCLSTVQGATEHCVIAAGQINITGVAAAVGPKALVLVATDTITVSGTLDAASKRSAGPPFVTIRIGAGSAPAEKCNAATTVDGADRGGAGGTFLSVGGNGGRTGGVAGGPQTAVVLRGGCAGQNGGGAETELGKGGHGGGALYLIADAVINIDGGTINVSGEGGHPGINNNAGGGGGGSGGLIGLDARTIMNTGVVFANGASGAEGADDSGGTRMGNPGPEPDDENASPAPNSASDGGAGGAGGAGGSGLGAATGGDGIAPLAGNGGGGGGGGGTGVIRVYGGGSLQGRHSPSPTR